MADKEGVEDLLQDNAVNPFIYNIRFDYVEHTQITVISGKEHHRVTEVEAVTYTKLYHVSDAQKANILDLNAGAFRLLMIIALNLAPDTDRIRIFTNKYMELLGITSRSTFFTAINGLIKASILSHYRKNVYWLNTRILFNGDRLKKYPGKGQEVGKKRYYMHNSNKKSDAIHTDGATEGIVNEGKAG